MVNASGRPARPHYAGLKRAVVYLARYKYTAVLPYLFLLIATLSQLAVPRLVGQIIDTITSALLNQEQAFAGREAAQNSLIIAVIAVVIFAVMRGLFAFLQVFTAERNSQGVAFDLRNDLFAKIQRLSFSYHDRNRTGQLMVRATDDVEKVRLFIGQGLMFLVQAFLLLGGTLLLLFTTNVWLALVVLPILPLTMAFFMYFGSVSQPLFGLVQAKLSALNTILQENMAGIKVIKAFAREPSEQAKFNQAADAVMKQQIAVTRLFALLFPLMFLMANLGQAAVLYFGGRQIISGTLTLGEWQEFSLYLIYLFMPLAQFGIIISQMGQASASAERIFEILDAKSEVADKPDAITLPPLQGQVTFDKVTFRYFNSGEPVLREVSFEAEPGQTVALLGATGSGKTTIINLIPRFYDASAGSVRIDGYDVRDVTLDSLRSQIGIVLQETTLFSGTIRENIAFGKPEASLDEIIEAAQAAAAHDFIMAFPQGYDTPVGERGSTLSGGQKQRLAIARALLLNPRLLILDDSTSSVDLATEAQIQRALDHLMQGRTSFVIAQRISTVLKADQILVLDKGAVVARGRHADLLENSPLYAEIYNSQLVDDAVAASQEAEPVSVG
ncbi:MAG: ABC transporter ATP-binding protein [Anaerolineae bacterium]|nr:ABC transporter ATP-binding protein [Anaerolineales bacterium]MCQ3971828.1 ABC transporter ATP-binding protein [Anaerolineae bacterium]